MASKSTRPLTRWEGSYSHGAKLAPQLATGRYTPWLWGHSSTMTIPPHSGDDRADVKKDVTLSH